MNEWGRNECWSKKKKKKKVKEVSLCTPPFGAPHTKVTLKPDCFFFLTKVRQDEGHFATEFAVRGSGMKEMTLACLVDAPVSVCLDKNDPDQSASHAPLFSLRHLFNSRVWSPLSPENKGVLDR